MSNLHHTDRPRDRKELARWYAAALKEQAASGLGVSAFALELGVTPATLYQWKRRLSGESSTQAPGTAMPSGLIQVSLNEDPSAGMTSHLLVRLGNKRCIEVPADFNDSSLRRLLATLESC